MLHAVTPSQFGCIFCPLFVGAVFGWFLRSGSTDSKCSSRFGYTLLTHMFPPKESRFWLATAELASTGIPLMQKICSFERFLDDFLAQQWLDGIDSPLAEGCPLAVCTRIPKGIQIGRATFQRNQPKTVDFFATGIFLWKLAQRRLDGISCPLVELCVLVARTRIPRGIWIGWATSEKSAKNRTNEKWTKNAAKLTGCSCMYHGLGTE